jgi:DNA-binding LytR/AlgR family response regulator
MKIVIIEDEQLAAQKLSRTLKEIVPDVEITGIIPSVEKALNYFNHSMNVELVFMDIQLEDGICFEIFEKIKVDIPIIFTTAFDEYTLKAFKQNSIDYLLKPIKKDELKTAIDKYNSIHQKINISTLQKVINDLKLSEYKERFLIKVGEHYKLVDINSINCFFIKDGYSFLNSEGNRNYGIDYSLDKIESLINPKIFFRVSRNFIIRFDAIEKIIAYSSSRLKIEIRGFREAEEIIVSRERVKTFKEWMDR